MRRTPVTGGEIGWGLAYGRRMRRFNLAVILAALIALMVIAPVQKAAWVHKSFEYGTWGGEIRPGFEPKPGDIVATEHWCSRIKRCTPLSTSTSQTTPVPL